MTMIDIRDAWTIRSALACTALLLVTAHPGTAEAESNCMARVLADVAAIEAPSHIVSKRSGPFGPLSAVKIAKKTGKMFYCAANSYCYDSNAFQIVTPCRLKLDKGVSSGSDFVYSVR